MWSLVACHESQIHSFVIFCLYPIKCMEGIFSHDQILKHAQSIVLIIALLVHYICWNGTFRMKWPVLDENSCHLGDPNIAFLLIVAMCLVSHKQSPYFYFNSLLKNLRWVHERGALDSHGDQNSIVRVLDWDWNWRPSKNNTCRHRRESSYSI